MDLIPTETTKQSFFLALGTCCSFEVILTWLSHAFTFCRSVPKRKKNFPDNEQPSPLPSVACHFPLVSSTLSPVEEKFFSSQLIKQRRRSPFRSSAMVYGAKIVHKLFRFCSYQLVVLIVVFILSLVSLYLVSACFYFLYCSYRFHQGLIEADKRHLWTTSEGVRGRFMPILIPVCDRPLYLQRVLAGLRRVDGINEVRISLV
jgi:hypothetical protein